MPPLPQPQTRSSQGKHIHPLHGIFGSFWKCPGGRRVHLVLRGWGFHPEVPRGGGWELHSHFYPWKSRNVDGKQGDEAFPCPGHKAWLQGRCREDFAFIPSPSSACQGRGKALLWELHHSSCPRDQAVSRGRDGLGWLGSRGWEATGALWMLLPRFPS